MPPGAVWFLLLLFFVARPVSVWLGLLGASSVSRDQRILISWFGIRGVGSIFYLMYAINHGLPEPLAKELIAITLTTVAASILLHGISVTPLMSLYARRKALPQRLSDGTGNPTAFRRSGAGARTMAIGSARRALHPARMKKAGTRSRPGLSTARPMATADSGSSAIDDTNGAPVRPVAVRIIVRDPTP